MSKEEILEDNIIQAIDSATEMSGDRVAKMLADLFKSAILNKYKVIFRDELAKRKVQKRHIDKYVDSCFADACVSYRQLPFPEKSDKDKEIDIEEMRLQLIPIKETIKNWLKNKGIEVTDNSTT